MLDICHSDISIQIDEADGGRAVSWRVGEHELLGANGVHPIDYGMYPMAPWAGRIRDNLVSVGGVTHSLPVNFEPWAIHGLVLSERFDVIVHESDHVVLQREFGPAWPVNGGVRCAWTLDAQGLTTEITSYGEVAEFPAVIGWHPWFTRVLDGVSASWGTDCTELLVRGADALPTGDRRPFDLQESPFDDVFVGGHHAEIRWPGVLSLEIENSHPWFVIYDGPQHFICIEPQTGPADGLTDRHSPVTLVRSDQPLVMRTQWRITREQQAD